MGADSKIQWTHHTFNPWWGCVKVDEACRNCYAEAFAKRTGNAVWGASARRRFFGEKHWAEPLKWNRAAEKAGERHRVFCASMADVFEQLPMDHPDALTMQASRAALWDTIVATPHLDWLLLTKRPENIVDMLPDRWLLAPRPNVWLGTTVGADDQRHRIAQLLAVPAVVHFVSAEPLIAPIGAHFDGIDWVIFGGESGAGARPCNVKWIRHGIAQCRKVGAAPFVKQLGARFEDPGNGIGGAWVKVDPKLVRLSRKLKDAHGGNWDEWTGPLADLRVREFPEVTL